MNEPVTFLTSSLPVQRDERWKAQLIVRGGVIYAPADASPAGEVAAFLSACFDEVTSIHHECHPFLPVDWLEQEYPSWADVYQLMRRNATVALTGADG